MDEIQTQIDDITARLDENDSSLSDFSDNLDSNLTDIQSTLDDQSNNIDTLTESSGQLTFPLSQDTIDLIKEQFPNGFVTLIGGTVTFKDDRISPTSVILLSVAQKGGTQGFLSYSATTSQMIVSSTDVLDTSVISYLIMN